MYLVCDQCHRKIKIPDEKVPKGKSFSINCPQCRNKISIDPNKKSDAAASSKAPKKTISADPSFVDSVSAESPENVFAFLEEGEETAMICEPDDGTRRTIAVFLEDMAYHISQPETPREALKQMRFHNFDLVVINEMFGARDPDANHVLKYLGQLKMDMRRDMFVVMVTERFKTMDDMSAFVKSVNLVVNIRDVGEFSKYLKRGISDYRNIYRVFRESMTKLGKV